jgi:L-fuconolactonase
VIDHLGRPDYADPGSLDNLVAMAALPNVYVKLSGYPHGTGEAHPYVAAHPLIERTLQAFGAERLMWGSDWPVCLPFATYEQAFRSAWELPFLADADRAWIFERSAREAWRLPE